MWPYIIWSLACMLLLPLIEWLRYKNEYGKKKNLNKAFTSVITFAAWLIVCFALKLFAWPVIFFAISCGGIRGLFYDPALNLFFGRYIDHQSETTNSRIDHFERKKKISFWVQRLLYLGVAVVFAVLYELTKKA